jgi:hypothetical protein
VLGTTSQLACVVGVAAVCDIVREDAGLLSAILMGLAVANMRACLIFCVSRGQIIPV